MTSAALLEKNGAGREAVCRSSDYPRHRVTLAVRYAPAASAARDLASMSARRREAVRPEASARRARMAPRRTVHGPVQ